MASEASIYSIILYLFKYLAIAMSILQKVSKRIWVNTSTSLAVILKAQATNTTETYS
jgi:hypothetical protein